MGDGWHEIEIKMAELTALARTAKTRPLSKEEALRLSDAVETVIALEAELRKKRPSMKRVRKRVARSVARLARNERFEGD